MKELIQELDRVYSGIQHLEIQPTKNNVAIILDALNVIEKAFVFIKGHTGEEEPENGRNDSAK